MQVPKIEKIVINMGVGRATQQPSLLEGAVNDLTTHHRPEADHHQGTRRRSPGSSSVKGSRSAARSRCAAIACGSSSIGWSAWPSPASATSAACRPTSWDGRGNYTFGLTEQVVFPEIDYDKIDAPRGMDITIVTTAVTNDAGQGAARRVRLPVQAGSRRGAAPRRSSAAGQRSAARAQASLAKKK